MKASRARGLPMSASIRPIKIRLRTAFLGLMIAVAGFLNPPVRLWLRHALVPWPCPTFLQSA